MSRRILAPVFLLAALAASAGAQTDTWLEVHTPNFVVVSNSSEKQSLRAALQFERMRSVFHRVFPNANLDTATPILVLAVADKRNLQALEPSVYLGKGQMSLAGLFVQMPERDYVLVWLNAPGLHPYSAVYHEYAHFVCTAPASGFLCGSMRDLLSSIRTPKFAMTKRAWGKSTLTTRSFCSATNCCRSPRSSPWTSTRLTTMSKTRVPFSMPSPGRWRIT